MHEVLKKLLFVFAIMIFFTGCAQQYQIHDIDLTKSEQGIVFGKLDMLMDGKPVPRATFWETIGARIILLPPGENKALVYKVGKDNFFYWGLEPGDYVILGFEIQEGADFTRADTRIKFTVSEKSENTYIGNLKVVMEKSLYNVGIFDDYSNSLELFKSKFPNASQPVKNLALLSEKLGNYKNLKYVCNDEWGIDCDNKPYGVGFIRFDGVKPKSPEVIIGGKTVISTLIPTLEWYPSSKENITYDIVIYETVSFSRGGIDTQYMPGKLLLYEENIKDAEYTLKNPLQPKNKYFWSIRLRLNDDVSSWSKFSYFQTIILFTGGGRSNWFNFETP